MNILILSRKSKSYFNQKLIDIAKLNNSRVTIVDPLECELIIDNNKKRVLINNKPLDNIDFIIPRMTPIIFNYGLNVLKQLELINIPSLNNTESLRKLSNRFGYLQTLSDENNIKIPKCILIRKSNQIQNALSNVKGPPAVLKVISPGKDLGAMLINSAATAESLLDMGSLMGGFGEISQSIIIEEYIKESFGKSINLLMLNNEMIACYYKVKPLDYKQASNLGNRTITGEFIPDKKYLESAQKAQNILKLDFTLFSFLESANEPIMYEVNPTPDIDEIEKISNFQIAEKIFSYTLNYLNKSALFGIEK